MFSHPDLIILLALRSDEPIRQSKSVLWVLILKGRAIKKIKEKKIQGEHISILQQWVENLLPMNSPFFDPVENSL